jgi:hypothetical protein
MKQVFQNIFTVLVLSVFAFTSSCQSNYNSYSGTYLSVDSLFSMKLTFNNDSVLGEHCFTAYEGQMIDCCLDVTSIEMILINDSVFQGKLISCYDDEVLSSKITLNNSSIELMFLENHAFIDKGEKIQFFK